MDLSEMMDAMAASEKAKSIRIVTPEEFEAVSAKHQPITGLKVGDKLKWKQNKRYTKVGNYDSVFTVFRLLDKTEVAPAERGKPLIRDDFTALALDESNGEVMEFAYSSRCFERVE